jgi:hypothetical protein
MENSESVIFSGNGGRLILRVSGYERPDSTDPYDANWLTTEVAVEAGPFAGAFKAAFSTYDFAELRDRLYAAVEQISGDFDFESTEGDLVLKTSFSARGSATVRIAAKPNAPLAPTISFTIESDQSILAETVCQLSAVLKFFPIREVGL